MKRAITLAIATTACAPGPDVDVEARIDAALAEAADLAAVGAVLAGMPLGGDLHHHFSGGLWAEDLIRLGASAGLCVDPGDDWRSSSGPCNGSQVSLLEVAAEPERHERLVDAWSMRGRPPGDDGAAAHFFSIFGRIPAVIRDVGGVVAGLRRDAAQEHVDYLETMLEWPPSTRRVDALADALAETDLDLRAAGAVGALRERLLADAAFTEARDEAVRAFEEALVRSDALLGCGSSAPDPGCRVLVRLVHFVLREASLARVLARAALAFEVAAATPIVVAVDIVGPETGARSRADYAEHMRAFGELGTIFPGVGRSLHAGELRPADAVDDLASHVGLALAPAEKGGAAARRIGHAVTLLAEPSAPASLSLVRTRPAVLAMNLRSNALLLGVRGDAHPLARFLDQDLPLVLASDDPGIFRSSLRQQFAIAALEHGVRYDDLRRMARNSLAFAFADEALRARLQRRFETELSRWETAFSDHASEATASR